jgi:hypothetical protein
MFPKVAIKDYENNKNLSTFREFFVPSWAEVGLYLLISFVTILVFNTETIWGLINSSSPDEILSAADAITQQLNNFETFSIYDLLGQLTGFVVWGIIGSFAYLIVWVIQHFYFRARIDAQEQNYIKSQTKASYWDSSLAQLALLVTATLVFVAGLISLFLLVPLMASLGRAVLVEPTDASSYLYLLLGTFVGAFAAYLTIRLYRIMKYAFASYFATTDD